MARAKEDFVTKKTIHKYSSTILLESHLFLCSKVDGNRNNLKRTFDCFTGIIIRDNNLNDAKLIANEMSFHL